MDLKKYVRTVPDFPEKGIMFRDVTTLFNNSEAFRAALKAADFKSTRGDFAFDSNHHPIQSIYAREVIKEGDVFTNKTLSVALKNHSNAYTADCKM